MQGPASPVFLVVESLSLALFFCDMDSTQCRYGLDLQLSLRGYIRPIVCPSRTNSNRKLKWPQGRAIQTDERSETRQSKHFGWTQTNRNKRKTRSQVKIERCWCLMCCGLKSSTNHMDWQQIIPHETELQRMITVA